MSPGNLKLVAFLLLACSSSRAYALLQSCSVSATALTFGSYDPSSATARDSTGTITVTCTATVLGISASWDILLSTGSSPSFTPRRMFNGGNSMQYNLYTNAARTQVWGDGTGGTAKVLNAAGVQARLLYKLGEGRPNILDLIKNGDMHFIINTPSGQQPRRDEVVIRSAAVAARIAMMTTLRGAQASSAAIRALKDAGYAVKSLQEYHRSG